MGPPGFNKMILKTELQRETEALGSRKNKTPDRRLHGMTAIGYAFAPASHSAETENTFSAGLTGPAKDTPSTRRPWSCSERKKSR